MSAATAPPPAASQPAPPRPNAAAAAVSVASATPAPVPVDQGRSTPSALIARRAVAALAVLVWALVVASQLVGAWQSTRTASADTAQLIRLQQTKVDLLRADALATNAFLVGGLESSAQRAAYDEAITGATTRLAAALRAQPADEAVLTELSALVVDYAATMELARANNLQGFPVGAAYLSQASTELQGRGIQLVDAVITANDERARASFDITLEAGVIAVIGIATVVVLWFVHRWLAQRFKRRFNVGLLLAVGSVVALTVGALLVTVQQSGENSTLLSGRYLQAVTASEVRGQANLARSQEALRLIARGSGQSREAAWKAAAAFVDDNLATAGLALSSDTESWRGYVAAHNTLVALDDGGDWDGAVAAATTPGADTATGLFTAFDTHVGQAVTGHATAVESTLDTGSWLILLVAGLAALAGLGGAAAAWRGLSRRLEEYV